VTRLTFSTAALLLLVVSICPAQEDIERPESERLAIRAIEKVRGWVNYDYDRPGRPVKSANLYEPTDDHLELLTPFPQLQGLTIKGGSVSDVGLARVARFAQLEHLHIERLTITEAGLVHISSLSKLKQLTINESTIAEAGLAHLARIPRLKRLSLRRSSISDAGIVHVEQLIHLRDVDLSGTQVTDAGVARLKEALPYALIVADRNREKMEHEHFFESLAIAGGVAIVGVIAVLGVRRWPVVRRRPWIWKGTAVAIAIGLVALGLWRLEPVMSPVQEGDAGMFWVQVCDIDVGAKYPRRPMGGFYQPRDGWFIYYDQGFHGQYLRRVPATETVALFPKLVEKLRKAPPGFLRPHVEQGFRAWLQSGADANDAAGFLAKVQEARLNQIRVNNPRLYEYVSERETDFNERWARTGRYHWNVRFEFAFLTALILFAAWPWLRGGGRVQFAIQLGLLPTLFYLPYWLGYAQLTFTSAGPSGGVLYPWLLALLRGLPWSDLDTMILRNMPQPLEPLSQTPGPMLSLSGFGGVGPVATIALGVAVFVAIVWGPWAIRWLSSNLARPR
jgi:hypothetical protein